MSFTVTLKPSAHQFTVDSNESILTAALRQSYALPYGCRDGNCGSCKARILVGRVHYPGGSPSGITEREISEGKALLCQAQPLGDLYIEVREVNALQGIELRTLPCRVAKMEKLAPDVMRLYLKIPASERLQFMAGQYISILLQGGRRRDFSLANAPHDDEYLEIHVRHVSGGEFTKFVFEQLSEKTILRFQGPLGSFFLREDSQRPVLMMGGGTGFAPLKGMLEHAFYVGITRPIHLYWGARARRDLYLHELPLGWVERYSNFHYTPVLSEPRPEDHWQGRTGWVHEQLAADYPDLSGHEVYMSGPPPMVEAAKKVFITQGLPEEYLYYDAFDFSPDSPGAGM